MTQNLFFDELMDEIGTQASAKLGHNIFKGDSYAAVIARAMATSAMQEGVKSYGKNPKGFGHNYENQQAGELNAEFAYQNSQNHAMTTDTISEIIQGVCASEVIKNLGKNANVDEIRDLLNQKGLNGDAFVENYLSSEQKAGDRANKLEKLSHKHENHYTNYTQEEMIKIAQNKELVNYKFNDTQNDIIILDKNGKVIEGYQLKATTAKVYDEQFDKYEKLMVDKSTYERWVSEKNALKEQINSDDFHKKPKEVQEKLLKQFKVAVSMMGDDGIESRVVCAGHKVDAGYTSLNATRLDEIKVSEENLKTLKKANSLKLTKSEFKKLSNKCDYIIKNSKNENEIKIAKETKQILENNTKTTVLVVDKIVDIEKRPLNEDTLEYLKDNIKEGIISNNNKKAYIKECDSEIARLEEKLKTCDEKDKADIKKEIQLCKDIKNAVTSNTDSSTAIQTTIKTQIKESGLHIAKTTLSDVAIVALSTLSSEIIKECKDEFYYNNHEDFTKRIERIISNVINAAKGAFARGAGFGVLDALITIASQIFKQIGGKIQEIWSNLRNAAKSIWNALWDYISGKIKTFKDFIKVALKAIFSMVVALFAVSLESQITAYLSPILSPLIAGIISTALTIFICAFAVVVFSRTLEISINGFFAICAKAEMAKKRREEIEALYDKIMPQMIENKENLEKYLNDYISDLEQRSELSFNDLQLALASDNYSKANDSICKLAELYGVKGLFKSNEEFVEFLENDEPWF